MSRWESLAYRTLATASTLFRARSDSDSSITIFMFHGIYSDPTSDLVSKSSRGGAELREGLRAIRERYRIISMDEALDIIEGLESAHENAAVITFDDSLHCLLEIAAPILVELEATATFYVSTDILDSGSYYWWHRLEFAVHHAMHTRCSVRIGEHEVEISARQDDLDEIKVALRNYSVDEQNDIVARIECELGASLALGTHPFPCAEPMRWEDAKRLAQMGMTIGSHSVSHINMNLLNEDELEREVVVSKRIIEERLGVRCDHFCYPYGEISEAAKDAVRSAGYRSATIVGSQGQERDFSDLYALPRIPMDRKAWKAPFQVSGQDDVLTRLRRLIKL